MFLQKIFLINNLWYNYEKISKEGGNMGNDAYVSIKKKYSKSAIEKILKLIGYEKRGDSFYCGNDDEYKLFTGVHVYLSNEDEQERTYRVRSPIYALGYDLKKMNETLRCLKTYCDATFESDYGKNRYFPEDPLIEGAESGCYFAVERLFNNFSSLERALSIYPEDMETDKAMYKMYGIPTPSVFNANVYSTYLCSLIEEYFKATYIALLKYSDRKEKILNVKFSSYDMEDISVGKKTVEEVFASTLSFQNIHKICSNFHTLDNKMDIGKALKEPYHKRKKNLYDQVNDILERRHSLIHHLELDTDYNTKSLQKDIKDITIVIKRVYKYLCTYYNWEEQELSI